MGIVNMNKKFFVCFVLVITFVLQIIGCFPLTGNGNLTSTYDTTVYTVPMTEVFEASKDFVKESISSQMSRSVLFETSTEDNWQGDIEETDGSNTFNIPSSIYGIYDEPEENKLKVNGEDLGSMVNLIHHKDSNGKYDKAVFEYKNNVYYVRFDSIYEDAEDGKFVFNNSDWKSTPATSVCKIWTYDDNTNTRKGNIGAVNIYRGVQMLDGSYATVTISGYKHEEYGYRVWIKETEEPAEKIWYKQLQPGEYPEWMENLGENAIVYSRFYGNNEKPVSDPWNKTGYQDTYIVKYDSFNAITEKYLNAKMDGTAKQYVIPNSIYEENKNYLKCIEIKYTKNDSHDRYCLFFYKNRDYLYAQELGNLYENVWEYIEYQSHLIYKNIDVNTFRAGSLSFLNDFGFIDDILVLYDEIENKYIPDYEDEDSYRYIYYVRCDSFNEATSTYIENNNNSYIQLPNSILRDGKKYIYLCEFYTKNVKDEFGNDEVSSRYITLVDGLKYANLDVPNNSVWNSPFDYLEYSLGAEIKDYSDLDSFCSGRFSYMTMYGDFNKVTIKAVGDSPFIEKSSTVKFYYEFNKFSEATQEYYDSHKGVWDRVILSDISFDDQKKYIIVSANYDLTTETATVTNIILLDGFDYSARVYGSVRLVVNSKNRNDFITSSTAFFNNFNN